MFYKISVLFSIFQVFLAANVPNEYNSTDSQVLAANIYDDVALANITQQLNLLHIKMDIIINQQLTIQRNELKKDLEKLKTAFDTQKDSIKSISSGKGNDQENCKYFYENLIEIRDEFNQQLKTQKDELKKELQAIKAALTTEIRGELNQQLTIQKNELIEDLEALKATSLQSLPKSCSEALKKSSANGIYKIEVPCSGLEPFNVYCLKDTVNASGTHIPDTAWLVIQRRQDGGVNFYRNWTEYKHGFGNVEGEFFIGLEKLHSLTNPTLHELWIQLEDFEGNKRSAKYSSFAVGDENEFYALNKLGAYAGDAGDSLSMHKGMKWSTFDSNNENCAKFFSGAWWYKQSGACHFSNLNGLYFREDYPKDQHSKGIEWWYWRGHYSLKYVHMAIRPVQ